MTTTTEFKFNCPECGQHIQVDEEWSGRRINCPGCNKSIVIPSYEAPQTVAPASVLPAPAQPKVPGALNSLAVSQRTAPMPIAHAPDESIATKPIADQKVSDKEPRVNAAPASAAPKPAEPLHVAVLTPAVKLDMVRAVRRRIADEASWISAHLDGANIYAAKVSDGKNVPVDPKSPEATRFSLIGAFLFELHLRHVVQTATGRTKFLDHEIPDAIKEVQLDGMSDEERERAHESNSPADVLSASHAQCLSALDVLEEQYSQRMEQVRAEKARRRLGNVRLGDLVTKLEKKARVAPEDVATALYHELMEVRRRLDRLESRMVVQKKTT